MPVFPSLATSSMLASGLSALLRTGSAPVATPVPMKGQVPFFCTTSVRCASLSSTWAVLTPVAFSRRSVALAPWEPAQAWFALSCAGAGWGALAWSEVVVRAAGGGGEILGISGSGRV